MRVIILRLCELYWRDAMKDQAQSRRQKVVNGNLSRSRSQSDATLRKPINKVRATAAGRRVEEAWMNDLEST